MYITTVLVTGFIFTDVSVKGFVVSPICPMNMVSGGFMPFDFMKKQMTKGNSHENHHGVIKAAMFASWAIPEIEADFYKSIKKIEEAAAMTNLGETVYAIRMSLKKFICEKPQRVPDECNEEKEKGYNCCVLVADRSPDIFPRRLIEYECVDFSAYVKGLPNEKRSLEFNQKNKYISREKQRIVNQEERLQNFTNKFHKKFRKNKIILNHH